MIAKRKPKRAAYGIQDKVRTLRGEGIIKHVFPRGPHGKNAYAVDFGNKRFGVIFAEDEITFLEKGKQSP
ncbi:MAG: hypothetical protein A3I02_04525 [Betaproteobacteria bacterium RIFCSPLOWO2_02_FULL_67_26]|nr:MAG: hypothetical protein A3I02_04525 [Betaproteobacteria bacterium RIFCSPLOWO2_02_FULL_67_26]